MQKILEFMAEENLEYQGLTEEECKLDEIIKRNLDEETLRLYLQLQDLIISKHIVIEKQAYIKGVISGIGLINNLSKL